MNRLRDDPSQDPVRREAARLLGAVTPEDPGPVGVARVWSRLQRAHGSRRSAPLRPFLALGLVLLLGALASAAALQGFRRWRKPTVPAAPATMTKSGHGHAAARASSESSDAELPPPIEPAVLPAPIAPPAIRPITSDGRSHGLRTPSPRSAIGVEPGAPLDETKPAKPAAAQPDPSTGLLQHAMRSLRHDHDAARAASLADDYLSLYPDGDLLEEALAIAIQAHSALGDGRATALAQRYLARFPTGRFHAEALLAR